MNKKPAKYRAIRKSDGLPVCGYLKQKTSGGGAQTHYYIDTFNRSVRVRQEVYANSVSLSTGLHDCAEVEVFEGDMVTPYGSDVENPFCGEIVRDGAALVLKCTAGTYELTQTFMDIFEVIQ